MNAWPYGFTSTLCQSLTGTAEDRHWTHVQTDKVVYIRQWTKLKKVLWWWYYTTVTNVSSIIWNQKFRLLLHKIRSSWAISYLDGWVEIKMERFFCHATTKNISIFNCKHYKQDATQDGWEIDHSVRSRLSNTELGHLWDGWNLNMAFCWFPTKSTRLHIQIIYVPHPVLQTSLLFCININNCSWRLHCCKLTMTESSDKRSSYSLLYVPSIM